MKIAFKKIPDIHLFLSLLNNKVPANKNYYIQFAENPPLIADADVKGQNV